MKRNRLFALLLALVMTAAMAQTAMANDYTAEGGSYVFDGSKIVATGSTSITDLISEKLEPGDSVDIVLTYKNNSSFTTDWYMENEVTDTLEAAAANPMNGGYSYKLTNVANGATTVIFDSDRVGGGVNAAGTGLDQATTATEADNNQDYFHVAQLEPGESGTTTLRVSLDGESQINTYQSKDAEIKFTYAVEKLAEGETTYVTRTVKTGDTTSILLPAIAFVAGLLLLIVLIVMRRKERKGGDRA